MKKLILALFLFCLIGPIHSVVAAPVGDDILTVLSRGHVQDLGDFPQDGSWVKSPDYVGTVGQSKRIEGFELKPGIGLPSDIQLCYNVHVQNKGWLYEEADPTTWAKNGDYAGTRGESLRIEAIKIVLLDASGNKASGYHIRYQGHIQNIGDLPVDASLWFYDGEQLGTVGSSLRLEALKLEIVKDDSPTVDLSAYTGLLTRIDSLNEADYTKAPWSRLQTELKNNVVTALNTQDEIDVAVKTITMAMSQLENRTQSMVYDKAGTYGPASGTETINQDVIITSRDVTLQNLKIEGALIIDDDVGDGNVTLNNIYVTGELRVRGAGLDSIHINGGDYPKIMVEQSLDGGVRIVGTNLEGTQIVIGENAAGEILILDGDFDSVTVEAPDAVVKTQGQTHIKHLDVMASAQNATIDLGSSTTVTDMALAAPSKVTGTGTVVKAEVTGNNVVFEKAPESYTVGTGVVVPPVFPSAPPPGGGGGGNIPPGKISLSVATAPTVTQTKIYNGTTGTDVTDVTLDATAITGIAAGDKVSVSATATYADKNAGNGKTITTTYRLSGEHAGKYNAPADTTVKDGAITPLQLTLSGAAPTVATTKIYDGTTATDITAQDVTVSNAINGDAVAATVTATYADKKVGSAKSVTLTYRLSGKDADNYQAPAGDTTQKSAITPLQLTLSGVAPSVATTKIYDGTSATDITAQDVTVSNAINGDVVVATATATYADKKVGENKNITMTYSLDGKDADNYQAPAGDTTQKSAITPLQLTLSGVAPSVATTKEYDGTAATNITAQDVTVNNAINGEDVKVTTTATYADKHVGPAKPVTLTYNLDGKDADNYLAPTGDTTQKSTITPLQLTLSDAVPSVATTKEYDGTTATTITDQTVTVNKVSSDDLFATATATYADEKVGSDKPVTLTYSLSGEDADNYLAPAGDTTQKSAITPLQLTLSGTAPSVATTKEYDGTTTTTITDQDVTVNNAINGEDVKATATATYADKQVGAAKPVTLTYSLSGEDADNYLAPAADTTQKSAITPLQLTLSGAAPTVATTKIYDGTTTTTITAQDVTVSNAINGEDVKAMATATYADKKVEAAKPVTLTYSLSGEDADNYLAPVGDTTQKSTITPKPLTIDNSKTTVENKTYDGTKTATVIVWPTVAVNDIIGGDQISYQGAATFADANAGVNKPVTITGSLTGADATNYQLPTSVTATATITPVEIKVATMLQGLKANEKEKVYDGKSTATMQVWWNNTDAPEIVRAAIAYYKISISVTGDYTDDQGVPKSAVGENYAIACHFTLSGIDSGNFILEGVSANTTGGKITKKPLTVSAPTVTTTKPYDGNTTAAVTAGGLIGVIESEDVTVSAVANYDVATVGINSTITVVYTLAGADAGNYVKPVNYILQNQGAITAAPGITSVTVAPNAATVAQGQTQQLIATVEAVGGAAETVIWTSSDTEGKVTVSDTGLVTVAEDAIAGNYTITATSTVDQAKSGTSTITVTKNNVMTTTYGGGSWAAWQHGNAAIPISAMTPPVGADNFKLFYINMNTSTYYGKGDDGKIYQSNDLKTWTDYSGTGVLASDRFTDPAYQLIGIASSGSLVAQGAEGKTLYYYGGSGQWGEMPVTTPTDAWINPIYYYNNTIEIVIYQKANGEVWWDDTAGSASMQLAAKPPALPVGFTQFLFAYDGTSLSMLAY
ncbi:YDG domain-containing protein [Acetobacterium malicum]|nr:YDG domain-containing protein [Acetobacterium malicum]